MLPPGSEGLSSGQPGLERPWYWLKQPLFFPCAPHWLLLPPPHCCETGTNPAVNTPRPDHLDPSVSGAVSLCHFFRSLSISPPPSHRILFRGCILEQVADVGTRLPKHFRVRGRTLTFRICSCIHLGLVLGGRIYMIVKCSHFKRIIL